ncbi:uncharacterized protein LOC119668887 isoform X2 [Teleopsis dalmanni]|uniref:uncharacterized protein LOC119668887 isoform X2 n=1 Tax=Teleopsis dalmanni TaxID=139649 RepID=UPI0018CFE35D|nr:uncharacterized protein LOC119668887 isoform X2 [Teleopsis dalmanni]XP_037934490.1 uncharacterized protein LOC119668887 isoform X2 [Teleopsis dalmanni]
MQHYSGIFLLFLIGISISLTSKYKVRIGSVKISDHNGLKCDKLSCPPDTEYCVVTIVDAENKRDLNRKNYCHAEDDSILEMLEEHKRYTSNDHTPFHLKYCRDGRTDVTGTGIQIHSKF